MKLSDVQLECLKLMVAGYTQLEISEALNIHVTTVSARLETARSNWAVPNNFALIHVVTKAGLM
jgi:DNA-binding CsgD family transcriptional regulator